MREWSRKNGNETIIHKARKCSREVFEHHNNI